MSRPTAKVSLSPGGLLGRPRLAMAGPGLPRHPRTFSSRRHFSVQRPARAVGAARRERCYLCAPHGLSMGLASVAWIAMLLPTAPCKCAARGYGRALAARRVPRNPTVFAASWDFYGQVGRGGSGCVCVCVRREVPHETLLDGGGRPQRRRRVWQCDRRLLGARIGARKVSHRQPVGSPGWRDCLPGRRSGAPLT